MKLLLITFPVDLGSLTLEKNLVALFSGRCDLTTFRFAARQSASFPAAAPDLEANLRDRFREIFSLRRAVKQGWNEGRIIFFQNISPALFAIHAWRNRPAYVLTDWTRKLFSRPDKNISPFWLTALHRHVLHSLSGTFCVTDAVRNSLLNDYGVPPSKALRARMPFDLERFTPGDTSVPVRPRLLFVGGDIRRKGGDRLLRYFVEKNLKTCCDLTFVSGAAVDPVEGVTFIRDLSYDDPRHAQLLRSHDLLVLPTLREGYPQIIGEAAAAGLAVITTRHSLGAPDVIDQGTTGFIGDSQQEVLEQTGQLIQDRDRLHRMKKEARKHMERHFALPVLFRELAGMMEENKGPAQLADGS